MMYTIFQKNGCQKLTINQLMHCLKRNFDGKLNCDIIAMFLENVSAKDIGEATNDRVCSSIYYYYYYCMCIVNFPHTYIYIEL